MSKVAGGGLPAEPRAQDQAPSGRLPSSGVGWHGGTPYTSWGGRYIARVIHAGPGPAVKHGCVAIAGIHPGDAACSVMNSRCPITPEPRTGCVGVCPAAHCLLEAATSPGGIASSSGSSRRFIPPPRPRSLPSILRHHILCPCLPIPGWARASHICLTLGCPDTGHSCKNPPTPSTSPPHRNNPTAIPPGVG